MLLIVTFIIIPILVAIGLSFTDFNSIQTPNFVGLENYVNILTDDNVFMEFALPNTIEYSIVVGVFGYILSFFLAWSLSQLTHRVRTVMTIIIYSIVGVFLIFLVIVIIVPCIQLYMGTWLFDAVDLPDF